MGEVRERAQDVRRWYPHLDELRWEEQSTLRALHRQVTAQASEDRRCRIGRWKDRMEYNTSALFEWIRREESTEVGEALDAPTSIQGRADQIREELDKLLSPAEHEVDPVSASARRVTARRHAQCIQPRVPAPAEIEVTGKESLLALSEKGGR